MPTDNMSKVPPNAIESENALIGAMLIDTDQIAVAIEGVRPDDFYLDKNKQIFEAIIHLFSKGEAVDAVTVGDYLDAKGALQQVGGLGYFATCIEGCPTAGNAGDYCRLVREKSMLRRAIKASHETIQACYEQAGDSCEIISGAEARIMRIRDGSIQDAPLTGGDIAHAVWSQIEHNYNNRGEVTGIATGLTDLDKITCGLQNGDFIVIAARPSMGKTALAIKIARNCVIHPNPQRRKNVGIFSLEMNATQIGMRIISDVARVDTVKIKKGFLMEEDFNRLHAAMEVMIEAPILIADTPNLTMLDVRAKARRMRHEHGLDLVVIDYLQLLSHPDRRASPVQKITDISRELKLMARELDIPVIALSQLSRAVEQRPNKRPMLSDLRESGAIEQDADVVMFIYRDSYYKRNDDADFEQPEVEVVELNIAKHRNGPTGMVNLAWVSAYASFENSAREPDAPAAPPRRAATDRDMRRDRDAAAGGGRDNDSEFDNPF